MFPSRSDTVNSRLSETDSVSRLMMYTIDLFFSSICKKRCGTKPPAQSKKDEAKVSGSKLKCKNRPYLW